MKAKMTLYKHFLLIMSIGLAGSSLAMEMDPETKDPRFDDDLITELNMDWGEKLSLKTESLEIKDAKQLASFFLAHVIHVCSSDQAFWLAAEHALAKFAENRMPPFNFNRAWLAAIEARLNAHIMHTGENARNAIKKANFHEAYEAAARYFPKTIDAVSWLETKEIIVKAVINQESDANDKIGVAAWKAAKIFGSKFILRQWNNDSFIDLYTKALEVFNSDENFKLSIADIIKIIDESNWQKNLVGMPIMNSFNKIIERVSKS